MARDETEEFEQGGKRLDKLAEDFEVARPVPFAQVAANQVLPVYLVGDSSETSGGMPEPIGTDFFSGAGVTSVVFGPNNPTNIYVLELLTVSTGANQVEIGRGFNNILKLTTSTNTLTGQVQGLLTYPGQGALEFLDTKTKDFEARWSVWDPSEPIRIPDLVVEKQT